MEEKSKKKFVFIGDEGSRAFIDVISIDEEADGITALATQFGDIKKAHENISKYLGELNDRWNECEKQLIEAMIEEGVSSVKIEGYGNFILSRSTYPNVNAANKPTFFSYLKASGNEGLLKLDVPANTLTAFLKRHVEDLKQQISTTGLTSFQAECLSSLPEYQDAAKAIGQPVDEMAADELASAILKSQGAAMFTKTGISLRK